MYGRGQCFLRRVTGVWMGSVFVFFFLKEGNRCMGGVSVF